MVTLAGSINGCPEAPMPVIRAIASAVLLFAMSHAGAATAQGLDLATAKVVDLTHPIDADTIFWPTEAKAFELTEEHKGITERGFFYAANRFCTPEHGGTHVDAPYHFSQGGESVADVPVDRLIGRAVVIDVSDKTAADPDYTLKSEDVTAWEAEHGQVPAGSIVLLRTGWSSRWPDKRAYLGDDTPGDASHLHFPSYGAEAAQLLVDRGASVLGVDTASVDHGPSKDFLVHRILGAANVVGLENVTNLDRLPPTGAWVMALPIKLAHGSGAPARVVALLP
jgi:kynurenine formamidase